jgi:hypothetical protein
MAGTNTTTMMNIDEQQAVMQIGGASTYNYYVVLESTDSWSKPVQATCLARLLFVGWWLHVQESTAFSCLKCQESTSIRSSMACYYQ